MKILKILCALGGMIFFSLTSASATTVIPMDLKELAENAELIFVGTVTHIGSEKEAKTIHTYVTFSDLQVLKGIHLDPTIEIRLGGGTVRGETVEVLGMPKFVVGERALIFLAGNFQYLCPIVGWGQGRYKVKREHTSGKDFIFDDADTPVTEIRGNKIVRSKKITELRGSPGVPDHGVTPEERETETRVTLEGFTAAIEAIMGIGE